MSNKPKLTLHKDQTVRASCRTLGMVYFLSALRDSNEFEINYHQDYLQTMRDYRGTILYYEGKKIYLDFWEYPCPTHTNEVMDGCFDLIVKLQHNNISKQKYLEECRVRNLFDKKTNEEIELFFDKIIPWSFFPSDMLSPYIGKEEQLWNGKIERKGFFCGKDWRCRRTIKKWMNQQNLEYVSSDRRETDGTTITNDQFLNMMKTSLFGIVAPGRGSWVTDTKNRREIDYMMMKKPILVPYKPNYYFSFNHGEHYIHWQGEDINHLMEKYDIHKIAENGYQWYLENASRLTLGKNLLKIFKERFG